MASTAAAAAGGTAALHNDNGQTTSLSKSKRHPQLWLHQTVSLDNTSNAPTIHIQPSTPNTNVYKRNTIVSRFRSKSGEENPSSPKSTTKISSGQQGKSNEFSIVDDRLTRSTFTHGTLHEEDDQADEKSDLTYGSGNYATIHALPSPTKRVTFLTQLTSVYTSPQATDNEDGKKPSPSARRVRKSKTLDTVALNSSEKTHPPRSPVMEFFNQIRTAPNAPWRSTSTSSSSIGDSSTISMSSANSGRTRSFTSGLRNFASFRQPSQQQSQQQPERKSSRQSFRLDGKEKRKRTRSYSFRAPNWLNVNKSKIEQQNLLRPAEPPVLKPIIRKRSISANNLNLLIMRQTSSEPEIVGSMNRDHAYREVLSNFTCYDLMPQQSLVIGLDCQYTGRQALQALSRNDVRVALLWDFTSGGIVGVLTGSDLLRILADHKENSSSCQCGDDVMEKSLTTTLFNCDKSKKTKHRIASVGCEASLRTASSLLFSNHCHRLPVINSKTNDVLYFLTKKSVLRFFMHHMSTLPTPAAFRRTLDELRLGTWKNTKSDDDAPVEGEEEKKIYSTTPLETLTEIVELFLESNVSALPVIDQNQRLIDSISKYDIMYFLTSNAAKDADLKMVPVEEILKNRRQGKEDRMFICPAETTLFIALERLIKTDTRRLYIIDTEGAFRAVVTISDILSFLMA